MNTYTSRHIFTYGSLMFASVWESVVAGVYRSQAAALAEHGRFMVMSETYPGIVARSGMQVAGLVYLDINAEDIDALDRFEGSCYRRCKVDVSVDNGKIIHAETYLFNAADRLTKTVWEPEHFALEGFMNTYCAGGKTV